MVTRLGAPLDKQGCQDVVKNMQHRLWLHLDRLPHQDIVQLRLSLVGRHEANFGYGSLTHAGTLL